MCSAPGEGGYRDAVVANGERVECQALPGVAIEVAELFQDSP